MLPSDRHKEEEKIENDAISETVRIVEGRLLDYGIIIAIGMRFCKPFERWESYRLGLIDAQGNLLRQPKTSDEKNALTPLDEIIRKVKKLIPMNLWYLLAASYIFRGFIFKENFNLYTEQEIQEKEDKKISLEMARMKVRAIIGESSKFSEQEFWNHYILRDDRENNGN